MRSHCSLTWIFADSLQDCQAWKKMNCRRSSGTSVNSSQKKCALLVVEKQMLHLALPLPMAMFFQIRLNGKCHAEGHGKCQLSQPQLDNNSIDIDQVNRVIDTKSDFPGQVNEISIENKQPSSHCKFKREDSQQTRYSAITWDDSKDHLNLEGTSPYDDKKKASTVIANDQFSTSSLSCAPSPRVQPVSNLQNDKSSPINISLHLPSSIRPQKTQSVDDQSKSTDHSISRTPLSKPTKEVVSSKSKMAKPHYIPPHLRPARRELARVDSMEVHPKPEYIPPHLRPAKSPKQLDAVQIPQIPVIQPGEHKNSIVLPDVHQTTDRKAQNGHAEKNSLRLRPTDKGSKVESNLQIFTGPSHQSSASLEHQTWTLPEYAENSRFENSVSGQENTSVEQAASNGKNEEVPGATSTRSTWPAPSELGHLSIQLDQGGLVSGQKKWTADIDRLPQDVIRSWQASIVHNPQHSIDVSTASFQNGSIIFDSPYESSIPLRYEKALPPERPEHIRARDTCQDAFKWTMNEASHIKESLKNDYLEELREKSAQPHREWKSPDEEYHNEFGPKVSIHLRLARPADLPKMEKIQQYWARSPDSLCNDQLPEISYIEEANLPWIVAVLGNAKSHGGVVGYFFAENFGSDLADAYRYTVEAQLFVSPRHLRLGIGRCLFDKGLAILDMHYMRKGGYDFSATDTSYEDGGRRDLRTIIFPATCPERDRSRLTWLKPYLGRRGFEQSATLKRVIYKRDQWYDALQSRDHISLISYRIDLIYFQRPTETTIIAFPEDAKVVWFADS
jgi:L-amino acid N-acyltransferase YncA